MAVPSSHVQTISLVEDDAATREFFQSCFERHPDFEVFDSFADADTALAGVLRRPPAIFLADWHLAGRNRVKPGRNGLELIAELKLRLPEVCCILITGYDLDHLPAEALRCGAAGFIYKFELPLALPRRVREIVAGQARWSPLAAGKIASTLQAEAAARRAALAKLTTRERDCLLRSRTGRPEKQVAADMGISPRTLHNHLHSVYVKLGAHSLLEACQAVWPAPVGPSPTPAQLPASRAPRPPAG